MQCSKRLAMLRGSAGRTVAAVAVLVGVAGASGFLAAGLLHSAPSRSSVPDEYLPQLVPVPAGEMTVSASGEPRRVTFDRPFLIGRFEVTFAQWDYCYQDAGCAHRPRDRGWGRADRPVIDVSWEDVAQYLDWLSEGTGHRYRLPTEDEWEYAARAGSEEPVGPPPLFTDPRLAWAATYVLEARKTKKTKPVSSNEGNAFGLFGTEGNVWEWTDSCRQRTYGAGESRTSRRNCAVRALQGEHKSYMPTFVRDIGSGGCSIKPMPGNFGFRVVREL